MIKRKVRVEGELVELFGGESEFTIAASSPADIFKCLECNFPKFREYLMECHDKGVEFMCSVADHVMGNEKDLLLNYGEGDMILSPVPAGSKKGITKLLAAIAIIVVVWVTGGFAAMSSAAASGTMTLGAAAAMTAVSFAINLALAGIQQMMAPDPSVDNDQDSSYLFQGTGQTVIEGDPVPILYGQLRVPGRPVSFQVQNIGSYVSNYSGMNGGLTVGAGGQRNIQQRQEELRQTR